MTFYKNFNKNKDMLYYLKTIDNLILKRLKWL